MHLADNKNQDLLTTEPVVASVVGEMFPLAISNKDLPLSGDNNSFLPSVFQILKERDCVWCCKPLSLQMLMFLFNRKEQTEQEQA